MDLLKAYKYGIKTLYYHNTRDGATDEQNTNKPSELATAGDPGDDDCEDGVCKL
jgi:ribonucleoside-diphosphate reductase alpha chain